MSTATDQVPDPNPRRRRRPVSRRVTRSWRATCVQCKHSEDATDMADAMARKHRMNEECPNHD